MSDVDAASLFRAITQYCADGTILPLAETSKVVFLMHKIELDAEMEHIKEVSASKVRVSNKNNNEEIEGANAPICTQMHSNAPKCVQMDFNSANAPTEEKESVSSPLSPSPSPTPLSIPPIIPQLLKEKEDLSHGITAPEKKNRKSQDYYGSLSDYQRERFDRFYLAYPKKSTKQECAAWWNENKPDDEMLSAILCGLEGYKQSREVINGYVLDPSRFLKRRRWEDKYGTEKCQLFTGNTVQVQKNPRGYDPTNGFSEDELERRKELSRQMARERGEL